MTRRKNMLVYKCASLIITSIAAIYIIGSLVNGYVIAHKIENIEVSVEQRERDKIEEQEEIKLLQEDIVLLEKEIDELTTVL